MAAPRGVSFEHKKDTECTDAKFHRHCQGRWRGSVSMGFDAAGKRLRRRVTGPTKTSVLETMAQLREELGRAPRSSRKYTVNEAVAEWLEGGRPGRSERTRNAYKEVLAPLLAKIGHAPTRCRRRSKFLAANGGVAGSNGRAWPFSTRGRAMPSPPITSSPLDQLTLKELRLDHSSGAAPHSAPGTDSVPERGRWTVVPASSDAGRTWHRIRF